MHHPWRAFRALSHIRLRWAALPEGLYGYTDHELGEVVLAEGLTQAERRCTIAHETQHVLRGRCRRTCARARNCGWTGRRPGCCCLTC